MKQTSDDRPDYGLPWLGNRPAPVERDRFYGFDSDYLETDADILSTQVLHRVSDTIRLDIQARYANYEREQRITEPLITPVPPAGTPPEQMSVYRYVFAGSSDETLLTTQAVARFDLGADRVRHALVTGIELARETSAPAVRLRHRRAGHELARSRFVATVHGRVARPADHRGHRSGRPLRCLRSTPGSSATRGT